MAFAEDLTAFMDLGGFAVQATATTRFGEVVQFPVIFDRPSQAVLGAGLMEASQPQAVARSADVTDITHGSPLTVNGSDYRVAEVQPDGTGMTTLLLESAA